MVVGGKAVPIDISKPNPNGIEFDNFYIDMNGIIHNLSHSEDLDSVPNNEDEMFQNMYLYVPVVACASWKSWWCMEYAVP